MAAPVDRVANVFSRALAGRLRVSRGNCPYNFTVLCDQLRAVTIHEVLRRPVRIGRRWRRQRRRRKQEDENSRGDSHIAPSHSTFVGILLRQRWGKRASPSDCLTMPEVHRVARQRAKCINAPLHKLAYIASGVCRQARAARIGTVTGIPEPVSGRRGCMRQLIWKRTALQECDCLWREPNTSCSCSNGMRRGVATSDRVRQTSQ